MPTTDTLSEWLSRWTRNPLGSARKGLNPFGMWMLCGPAACTATAGCGLRSFEPALVELRSVFAKTCRAGTRFTCHPELSLYSAVCHTVATIEHVSTRKGSGAKACGGAAHFLHASKSTKQGRQQDKTRHLWDSSPRGETPLA